MSVGGVEGIAVIINNLKVTGSFINTIHDLKQGNKLLCYWNTQGWLPAEQRENIDWDVIKHTRALLPFNRRLWMMKQVSGFCGTGEKMRLWKYSESDMCSLRDKREDNTQVLRCNSVQANPKWSASIDALEDHLLDNNTPSNTVNMIVN